jgi:hypothetical protein
MGGLLGGGAGVPRLAWDYGVPEGRIRPVILEGLERFGHSSHPILRALALPLSGDV